MLESILGFESLITSYGFDNCAFGCEYKHAHYITAL